MKNWNSPEIVELNVSDTEHQIWPFWERDGGTWGDGIISGHFGTDPKPAEPKPVNPNPTTDPSSKCSR